MSHIVHIKTEVRDAAAVNAACERLKLPAPVHDTVNVFQTKATGLVVKLPEWLYPIVCDVATGNVQYDNYAGNWGQERELHRFLQAYAVEKAKIEARKKGHTVTEKPLACGSIMVTLQVNGGAA